MLPEVIDPFLAIINSSLSLGYAPKTFKLAFIKPLIKKTQLDSKDLVNYRPISNLPFLSKILEKVASSQLYSFLEKNYICEAICDDTIDHNILLNRLENSVGISGSALAWFNSYLSDLHQFVAVNEEVSYQSQVQYGVRQGSVLGPLLFTHYMLSLGNIIRKHGVSF